MQVALLTATAIVILGTATLARYPLARWYRKVRRRKPGVYLVRVDHHINRARRVVGYVGESVNVSMRRLDHLGQGRFGQVAQPWSDLRPHWYVIRLPWWMGWKWVLRPLETLIIVATWPVYNDAKNRWNPRRIPKTLAAIQRRKRDEGTARQIVRTWTAHAVRYAVQGTAAVITVGGAVAWLAR